ARRSLDYSAASTPKRLAVDLCVLHDFGPAHLTGFSLGPISLCARGGTACPLSRFLHADAAGTLCGVDRVVAAHSPHRQVSSGGAVHVKSSGHPRSITMTRKLKSQLKAGVAFAAIAAQLVFLAQPALAFCGFYVAKADSKLFNRSSKVVLARDGRITAI